MDENDYRKIVERCKKAYLDTFYEFTKDMGDSEREDCAKGCTAITEYMMVCGYREDVVYNRMVEYLKYRQRNSVDDFMRRWYRPDEKN